MLRNFSGRALVSAVGIALAVAALPIGAQLSNSKHNLTSSGPGYVPSDPRELCVFCHTPMGTESTALVPQWNLTLRSPSTYRSYDSLGTSSMTGQVAPVGSVSLVCLSCHDGTQAMSAVINSTSSSSLQSTGTYPYLSASLTGPISSVGTDLRDDHPVGVQYGGGGLTETAPSAPTRNPDFRAPQTGVLNEVRIWWVETEGGGTGTRRKTDLSLYTRTRADGYTGQSVAEPFVECASCHDPHTDRALFLRISNTRSALCLTCHVL